MRKANITIGAWPDDTANSPVSGTIRDTLNIVFRRKLLVVTFFLGTVVTVLLFVAFSKPMYKASAQLLVSPGREHVADVSLATAGAIAPRLEFNAEEQIARTTDILTGRFLAEHVVRAIGPTVLFKDLDGTLSKVFKTLTPAQLIEKGVDRFLASVGADAVGKSSFINLTFKHPDPQVAAQVVNTLSDLYVKRHLDMQKNRKGDTVLQEQFQVVNGELNDSERELEALKQRYGIVLSTKDEQESALKQMLTSQAALHETQKQEAEVNSRVVALRAQLNNTSRNPGEISAVQDKLTSLELQESELAQQVTSAHPTLRALRREIAVMRKKLTTLEAHKTYGNTASRDGTLYGRLQEELLRNEAQQMSLAARAAAEARSITEYKNRLAALERISLEFKHLQQKAHSDGEKQRLYLNKLEESRIAKAMDAESMTSVRVVDPAQAPSTPVNSKASLKILLSLIFGLVGGVSLAFILHFVTGRLDTIEDVERCLGLPVLASIPELSWDKR